MPTDKVKANLWNYKHNIEAALTKAKEKYDKDMQEIQGQIDKLHQQRQHMEAQWEKQ